MNILYDNGAKVTSIPFLFDHQISAAEKADENLQLFTDFTIQIIDKNDRNIAFLKFHDGNQITSKEVTFKVTDIPFNEQLNLKEESKRALLFGDPLPFEVWLPRVMDSAYIDFWFSSRLVFTDFKFAEAFISEIKEAVIYPEDSRYSEVRCQAPRYNWYPACNIKLTDEPRIKGTISLLSRDEAQTPDVQAALEEIIFRFASLRYNHNPEGRLTIEKVYFIESDLDNSAQLLAWVRLDNGERAILKTFVVVIHNLHQDQNLWVYWHDSSLAIQMLAILFCRLMIIGRNIMRQS